MDYEKEYKEVKALIEDCIPDEDGYIHVKPSDICPELAESEDERTRKEIINYLEKNCRLEWAAWLEKQGEQKPTDVRTTGYWLVEDTEQKPAWSEEDEEIHRKCICAMRASACGFPEEEKFVEQVDNWLKSLKDRYMPQPKAEWSKEDEKMLKNMSNIISDHYIYESLSAEDGADLQDWLKSLKDRVQPKQEWSEEDEVKINRIVACLENLKVADNDILLKDVNWLKSLRPQNTWKPSEEQIKALNYVVNLMASSESPKENDYYYNVFKDLREQLKKLKG